jgi:hypothetical protein
MRDVDVGKRERHGMRVKDLERKKRVCGEREDKNERGRGKHINGSKRKMLNESE